MRKQEVQNFDFLTLYGVIRRLSNLFDPLQIRIQTLMGNKGVKFIKPQVLLAGIAAASAAIRRSFVLQTAPRELAGDRKSVV